MPKTRLIRKYLSVLVLVSALCRIPQLLAQGEEEKRPLIDVEDYNVEVELLPAANQVKAKASIKFTVAEATLNYVIFDFNGNLKPDKIYFAGKPPLSSLAPVPPTASSQTQAPYLTRGAKKKPVPSPTAPLPAAPDPNQLRFNQSIEDHTLRVDFNSPFTKSQSATLIFEYTGTLKSSEHSPLEGVLVASVNEDVPYLLAIARWFPINRCMRDRATATFR
ncbi:MAG: hypothetical protein DMG06_09265, partial [Acidobacteria bacterium]